MKTTHYARLLQIKIFFLRARLFVFGHWRYSRDYLCHVDRFRTKDWFCTCGLMDRIDYLERVKDENS